MTEIDILALSHITQFSFDFLHSVHVSFCSSLIFSIQGENGQDYCSWTTLNEAEHINQRNTI